MLLNPTLDEFRQRATQGNLVPVWAEILADLETPVSLYRKLRASGRTFLLESVENGEQLGRYTFLGFEPRAIFTSRDGRQHLTPPDALGAPVEFGEKPLHTLRAIMSRFRPVADEKLPPFTGGLVGYMAYDTIRDIEDIPDSNPDALGVPDYWFLLTDQVIAFDHVRHRLLLIVNAHIDSADIDGAYADAVARLHRLHAVVLGPHVPAAARNGQPRELDVRSNMSREQFEHMVERGKEYIAAGDIFQVVLSQRFSVPVTCEPFDVYRALRAVNPSPYMFFLDAGDFQIAGSSPEILVRCADGQVIVRPIAGTRPRGATPAEDKAHEQDLLADAKERAEHVMLVDLGRNDVGRVSEYASVRVTDFMIIERYSHVMHIVSNVVGKLRADMDAFDALAATFPAGTVSGAPKIRAMQIIDELEPTRRCVYAGSVVYFGFNGAMDSCITLRTAVIKDGQVHIQAGGGVVADSSPAGEYQESVNKAKALVRAVEWAEQGLD
jgi:anthranilate synthase component 1